MTHVTAPLPTIDLKTRSTHEGVLLEMELRLRSYIDEVGRWVESRLMKHFEQPLAELNRKIDVILAVVQSSNASILNLLQQE